MYLTSLTLRDFAGTASATLPAFEPGLNIVVGDNEAGKSTLLQALRAAFFQKHRAGGEAAKALAPYGRQVRPEIEVGFEVGGTPYRLRKAFLVKPEAELEWAGGRLSGDAVEDRLAELFRFSHSGARKAKEGDFAGAFGLLWVEQGRSTQGLDVGAGRDAVTASLEGEVSHVLGGERGRALLAYSKSQQDRFFTNSLRASINSPLKEAEERLTELREALSGRETAYRDYEAKLDRLATRRETLRSYEREDAVGKAAAAVTAAEEAQRAIADIERDCDQAGRDLKHALAARDRAAERLKAREGLIEGVRRAGEAAAAAREARDELAQGRARDLAEIARLEAAHGQARVAMREADAAHDTAVVTADRLRIAADIARLETRLAEVRELDERLRDLRRAAAAAPALTDKDARAVEAAEQARRDAEIRLSIASPTIRFEPEAGRHIRDAAGAEVASETALPVTSRTVFTLEGFGCVQVEPGGDAADLARARDKAAETLAALLDRHRLASPADVRRTLSETTERAREIASAQAQIAAILPEGLDASVRQLDALRAELDRFGAPGTQMDTAPDPKVTGVLRQTARARLDGAEAAADAARKAAAGLAAQLAKLEADAAHGASITERMAADLAEADRGRTREALAEDLAAAELERAAREAVAAQRRRALDGADAETVARTLSAKRRAFDEIGRTLATLKDETASLEGELRVQGATSLAEEIARLGGEIESWERRRRRLAIEADAARILHQTFTEAQREARESWLGPIKQQVAPYLRLIHPESDIALDETTLEITGLRRRGIDEDFKRLSAGAREQVAVVTRLALADVLKRGGHPAAVILDDALVNTDEKRLERMHKVLQKAAEGLQIIILTCRERDFRDIGAPIFRL
ncbi:ATP-binding protein [Aureimonas sp. AU12]|uniref:AAA family ATPase n=1 Tax=Aureimonas sp. AU12 TaxID=1638161 RepID=UPI000AFC2DE7|nr:ATP-binding protein [Aureimonas sp. AU12]